MNRLTAIACSALVVIAGSTALLPAMQLQTPAAWKWRTDSPARVTDSDKGLTPDKWFFVAMPPGWHITSSPGVVIYNPAVAATFVFKLESEAFLFPGASQEEYGIFIGGRDLEQASTTPSYTAFVARRDGRIAVLKRNGATTTALVDWKTNDAVIPQTGTEATKNTFLLDATASEAIFLVNGKEVARVPNSQLTPGGLFGLRAGANLNLHVTTLNATMVLAPVATKK
jgi:hypothetical protein